MKRQLVVLAAAVAIVAAPATALAHGPSGSDESPENQVTCAEGTDVPNVGKLFVGTSGTGGTGVEYCRDAGVGTEGRVIVGDGTGTDGHGSPYVVADGDADNTTANNQGFIGADTGGYYDNCPGGHDGTHARGAAKPPPPC